MNKTKTPSTREELQAARARIIEQMQSLEYVPIRGSARTPYKVALIEKLRDILREIDERLANLNR